MGELRQNGGGFEVFIRGVHLDLVALEERLVHASNWVHWFNDPETTRFMQHGYRPNTVEDQLAFFREGILANPARLQLGIVPKDTGVLAGMVSLFPIDHVHRKAEVNMVLGERQYRGTRYSVETIGRVIDHAFDNLNLRRIYGGSLSREWTVLLCRVFNFCEEGSLREDVYKGGTYHDIYNIGLLKDEYHRVDYGAL